MTVLCPWEFGPSIRTLGTEGISGNRDGAPPSNVKVRLMVSFAAIVSRSKEAENETSARTAEGRNAPASAKKKMEKAPATRGRPFVKPGIKNNRFSITQVSFAR